MVNQAMVDNVEKAWMRLKARMEILNKAEHMHETVMRFHDPEYMYLTTTADMSRKMVVHAWNMTMDAQDDLGWALESLLNGCQSTIDEEA
jgi:hypothetical protein